jgi:hypothetical protein
MRLLGWVFGAAAVMATQAAAGDARFEKSLQMLDPAERLEQLCDYTAMTQIRREAKTYRPDRAVAHAQAEAQIANDTVQAKGGAFRSRGKWYSLTYTCTASPDHLKVVSFHYAIGAEIPETKWTGYGLWD